MDQLDAAERFALGQMEGRELDDFLARLLLDPDLQAEVAAARERIKAARGLTGPPPAPGRSGWRWLGPALLLILAGAALFWFFRSPVSPEAPVPPAAPAAQQPVAGTDTADTREPAPPRPADDSPGHGSSRRMAANFQPNPALEYLAGANAYRSGQDQEFRWVIAPKMQVTPHENQGKVRLSLQATAEGQSDALKKAQWQVFTNQESDYEAGRPVQTGDFLLKTTSNDRLVLSGEASPELRPGLYYFLIEDRESGNIYFVGRFVVE